VLVWQLALIVPRTSILTAFAKHYVTALAIVPSGLAAPLLGQGWETECAFEGHLETFTADAGLPRQNHLSPILCSQANETIRLRKPWR
jgi:hypothetical protein